MEISKSAYTTNDQAASWDMILHQSGYVGEKRFVYVHPDLEAWRSEIRYGCI